MRLRHLGLAVSLLAVLAAPAFATEVWSNRTFTFSKASGANPALAANQDRIRSNAWITRGSTQGIYNAFSEAGYGHFSSPAGTEWATGDAVNHSSLTFKNWEQWQQDDFGGPLGMVNVNAVVHLIADDIYVDIRFLSWQSAGSGGAFSYIRAVQPSATPTQQGTWGAIKAMYR